MTAKHLQRVLQSRRYKIVKRLLLLLLLLWWLLLSHVTFSSPPKKAGDFACFIDQYHISVESPLPINPMGLWLSLRYIKDDPYYLVVYDNQGHYIGQSSITLHNDNFDQPNSKKENACNRMDIQNDKIITLGDNVTVPLHHKKWWSWILQWFHLLVPDWILQIPLTVRDYMLQLLVILIKSLISRQSSIGI